MTNFLFGNTTVDNANYVAKGLAVIDHLGDGWENMAIDGNFTILVTKDLIDFNANQVNKETDNCVISTGIDDVLLIAANTSRYQEEEYEKDRERILKLGVDEFQEDFKELLEIAKSKFHKVHCIMMYKPTHIGKVKISEEELKTIDLINELMRKICSSENISIIETEDLFQNEEDFCKKYPTEPSETGGKKLAERIKENIKS